jgi:hypothetical protein
LHLSKSSWICLYSMPSLVLSNKCKNNLACVFALVLLHKSRNRACHLLVHSMDFVSSFLYMLFFQTKLSFTGFFHTLITGFYVFYHINDFIDLKFSFVSNVSVKSFWTVRASLASLKPGLQENFNSFLN